MVRRVLDVSEETADSEIGTSAEVFSRLTGEIESRWILDSCSITAAEGDMLFSAFTSADRPAPRWVKSIKGIQSGCDVSPELSEAEESPESPKNFIDEAQQGQDVSIPVPPVRPALPSHQAYAHNVVSGWAAQWYCALHDAPLHARHAVGEQLRGALSPFVAESTMSTSVNLPGHCVSFAGQRVLIECSNAERLSDSDESGANADDEGDEPETFCLETLGSGSHTQSTHTEPQMSCAFCEAGAVLNSENFSEQDASNDNPARTGQETKTLGCVQVNAYCDYQGHCVYVSDLPSRDGIFIHIPCPIDDDGDHTDNCPICRLTRSNSF